MSHRGFVSGMQLLSFPPSTLPAFLVVLGDPSQIVVSVVLLTYYIMLLLKGGEKEGRGKGRESEGNGKGKGLLLYYGIDLCPQPYQLLGQGLFHSDKGSARRTTYQCVINTLNTS